MERQREEADLKAVGFQLWHPHHPVQPSAKVRHEYRPPVRSARQCCLQALVRNDVCISSVHAVLGKIQII
jgi:hypothetical protein